MMVRRTLLGAVLIASFVACDDKPDAAPPEPDLVRATDEPRTSDGLLFLDARDNVWELNDGVVECRPSEEDSETSVVRLTAPVDYRTVFRHGRLRDPFFYVEAVPGTTGRFELPLHLHEPSKGEDEESGVASLVVFGANAVDQNEMTGARETATGVLEVLEATCDPEPRLAFTIHATLASENGLGTVYVHGGLEAGG